MASVRTARARDALSSALATSRCLHPYTGAAHNYFKGSNPSRRKLQRLQLFGEDGPSRTTIDRRRSLPSLARAQQAFEHCFRRQGPTLADPLRRSATPSARTDTPRASETARVTAKPGTCGTRHPRKLVLWEPLELPPVPAWRADPHRHRRRNQTGPPAHPDAPSRPRTSRSVRGASARPGTRWCRRT
jgi:hypothetical protein